MTKKVSAYIKKRDELVEQFKKKIEENIHFGHEFTENFKNGNTYYLQYPVDVKNNGFNAKLIGFLKVIDEGLHYYRTSKNDENVAYTAVWLSKARHCFITDNLPASFKTEIEKLPYMAFLQGCDDGSWIKYFSSEQEAIDFFKKHETLDNVINFCDTPAIIQVIQQEKNESLYSFDEITVKELIKGNIFSYN